MLSTHGSEGFGWGFYQTLGELQRSRDRVYFAGYTQEGQRIGLTFRRGADSIEMRPMTPRELTQNLKNTSSDNPRTVLRVKKSLTTKMVSRYREYLVDRIMDGTRYPIDLNETLATPLASSNGNSVEVSLDRNGYIVKNPGTISPYVLFELLIIPRQGEESGMDRSLREKTTKSEDLLKTKVRPRGETGTDKGKVVLASGGVGIEVVPIEGINLMGRTVIDLPANIQIGAERGEVILDEVSEASWQEVINQVLAVQDPHQAIALANSLMEYWEISKPISRKHALFFKKIGEQLYSKLKPRIEELKIENDLVFLPATETFKNIVVAQGETPVDQNKVIHVHPSLFDFEAQGVPGLVSIGEQEGFESENGYRLWHATYQGDGPHPPFVVIPMKNARGGDVIITREHYEWAKTNPLRLTSLNLRMSYQIHYGPERATMGWLYPKKRSRKRRRLGSNESIPLDAGFLAAYQDWERGGNVKEGALKNRAKAWDKWLKKHPELSPAQLIQISLIKDIKIDSDDLLDRSDGSIVAPLMLDMHTPAIGVIAKNGQIQIIPLPSINDIERFDGGHDKNECFANGTCVFNAVNKDSSKSIVFIDLNHEVRVVPIPGSEEHAFNLGIWSWIRPDGSLIAFKSLDVSEETAQEVIVVKPDGNVISYKPELEIAGLGQSDSIWTKYFREDGSLVFEVKYYGQEKLAGGSSNLIQKQIYMVLTPDNRFLPLTQKELGKEKDNPLVINDLDYDSIERPDGSLVSFSDDGIVILTEDHQLILRTVPNVDSIYDYNLPGFLADGTVLNSTKNRQLVILTPENAIQTVDYPWGLSVIPHPGAERRLIYFSSGIRRRKN